MIIATQTAAPTSTAAADLSVAASRTGADGARGAADPLSRPGFGKLLAQRLEGRGANDLPPPRPDDGAPSATLGADGQPILVATSGTAVVPDAPTGSTDPTRATVRGSDDATRDDDEEKPDGSQAGDDLAAQLALVSQWAAVARPAATPAKPSTEATSKDEGPDIQRKLDAVRGTAKPAVDGAAVEATADRVATGTAPATVAATTIATATPTQGARIVDRPARTGASAGLAAEKALEGKPTDIRPSDAAPARSGESLVAAIVAAFDGTAAQATTVQAGAFVTQLAAATPVGGDRVAAPAPTLPTSTTLHETVGTPAWSHEVGQATLRMAAADLQTASLQLNPAHLGPLDVQLRIDNGVAHLAFGASHAETRQALEASRTTLDQLLGDQGLKLGDCSVSDQSASSRGFAADGTDRGTDGRTTGRDGADRGSREDGADATPAATVAMQVRKLPGLVDTFA